MERIIFILLIALISCKEPSSPNLEVTSNKDSVMLAALKRQYLFQHQLDSLEHTIKDSLLLARIQHYKEQNDANIIMNLNYKDAVVRSYMLEDKLEDLEKSSAYIFKEVQDYKKKYVEVIKENQGFRNKLENEVISHTQTKAQKDKLQEDVLYASKLKPVGIRIEGINKTIGGKEVPTLVAHRIDWVNVYFTLPENKLATKETKKILVIMLSSDGKDSIERDTEIDYVGNQITEKLILNGKDFTPGPHQVSLYINGELKSKNTIVLLKR